MSTESIPRQSINDPLDRPQPATVTEKGGWKPEGPGAYVQGEAVDFDATQGNFDPYYVWSIQEASGRVVYVHAFHDNLKVQIAKARLQVGDQVRITLSHRAGAGGEKQTDPYIYRVTTIGVDRREKAPVDYGVPTGLEKVEEPPGQAESDVPSDIPSDVPWSPNYQPPAPPAERAPQFTEEQLTYLRAQGVPLPEAAPKPPGHRFGDAPPY
jgi:hypothetical protein